MGSSYAFSNRGRDIKNDELLHTVTMLLLRHCIRDLKVHVSIGIRLGEKEYSTISCSIGNASRSAKFVSERRPGITEEDEIMRSSNA